MPPSLAIVAAGRSAHGAVPWWRSVDQRLASADDVVARLKQAVAPIPGMTVFFQPVQDIQISTRSSRAQYQYTLVGSDTAEVIDWADKLTARNPRVKVLFVSGYSEQELSERVVLAENRAFLDKPFTASMLARKLREMLDS